MSHDFDFIFGRWRVRNRKLANLADPECTQWVEFDGIQVANPILSGIGNIDFMTTTLPTGEDFEGMSLRLFDPEAKQWRIWWSSTGKPGHLEPPVMGAFTDGVGTFVGEDMIGGRPALVELTWADITADSARWSQRFSFDNGRTWGPENWIMTLTRLSSGQPAR